MQAFSQSFHKTQEFHFPGWQDAWPERRVQAIQTRRCCALKDTQDRRQDAAAALVQQLRQGRSQQALA